MVSQNLPPKISVCIPVFNGANYIEEAIRSVLNQTFKDFELIIVDNASTDGTVDILDSLKFLDNRIHVFRNDQNIGLAPNLNKCVDYANGEYIKFLCADDLLKEDCLSKMVAVFQNDSSIKLVASSRILVDESKVERGVKGYQKKTEKINGIYVISKCLYLGNYIGEPSAVMFKKIDFNKPFRKDLPQLMDLACWFELLESGYFYYFNSPLCTIRIHDAQMSNTNLKSGRILHDNEILFEDYFKKPYIISSFIFRLFHRFLMTYRVWKSRDFADQSIKHQILSRYGSRVLYLLMPLLVFIFRCFKKNAHN